MYAIRLETDLRLRTNTALAEYARLEYGHEDVGWLLASVRRGAPKRPRRSLASRLRFVRPRPTPRPVACKGSPRLPSEPLSPA